MNKQREKIATQTEIIHELGSKMEKLKSRPLRKTLLFKNAKHNQGNEKPWFTTAKVQVDLIEATKQKIATNIERPQQILQRFRKQWETIIKCITKFSC